MIITQTYKKILRANTNTSQCGNFSLNNSNNSTCKTTNYIVPSSTMDPIILNNVFILGKAIGLYRKI